ncbi:nitrate reductase molybdenum cofactor assembly chaperone [Marinimicrobium agarilyticum]|uniref:nitrate reductase molybdenum cofactor assembly chaperone n=1 Tax=Marinimicrobium agarilyticum TaxID=306546 RepID=UPI0004226F9D|nr:nitrate reductase molybdenum cofactor assembly chaperone [Marinimicrobium agarilyticum]
MKSLRVISLLMEYPTAELMEARGELKALVARMNLKGKQRDGLLAFVEQRTEGDLMDWQSEYDALFERGRSLSLLLFEHVHGESRDRGQAMVDLMNQYQQAGLAIDANELPDYLPLYLEFLSTQGPDNARAGLQEVEHILGLLAARLKERESNYAALFEALLHWCGDRVNIEQIREQVAGEARDDTPEALDKVWEEEAVTFGPDAQADGCNVQYRPDSGQRRDQEQILNLMDPQPVQKHQEA